MFTLPIKKELFWDLDLNVLDNQKNKTIIIERVLQLGDIQEFQCIEKYYGKQEIKKALTYISNFDPKTLAFVLSYYNLSINQLVCYTKRHVHQKHWN